MILREFPYEIFKCRGLHLILKRKYHFMISWMLNAIEARNLIFEFIVSLLWMDIHIGDIGLG